MIIGIPVYDGVDLLDVTGPFAMFAWAGFAIDLLALQPGLKASGRRGFAFSVSRRFAEARAYDAIWVPGGEPDALAGIINDPARTYLDFLATQATSVPMMCSVCNGAMLLAAAGLLDGYQATTHWEFLSCFPQRLPRVMVPPAHPRSAPARSRPRGGGVSSGLDAALKLIDLRGGPAPPQQVQQTTQPSPAPPVRSDIPPAPAQCRIP